MSNVDEILEERNTTHGDFKMNAIVSQGLKAHLELGTNWDKISPDKKEALEMICHKMARIVNGDNEYKDSWTDIIGYASLIEKDLK